MTDKHNLSFFGQKTGIIIGSTSKNDPHTYIRCIKKKKNGEWEKLNEGKTIKLSLIESIAITNVVNKSRQVWNTFHSFNGEKTPISVAWDEYDNELLWINIDNYTRPLNYPEYVLFLKLFEHLVKEKIENATSNSFSSGDLEKQKEKKVQNNNNANNFDFDNSKPQNKIREFNRNKFKADSYSTSTSHNSKSANNEEFCEINGKVKIERQKALLIETENAQDLWIPKSTILNEYNTNKNTIQTFKIKKWVIEKRKSAMA